MRVLQPTLSSPPSPSRARGRLGKIDARLKAPQTPPHRTPRHSGKQLRGSLILAFGSCWTHANENGNFVVQQHLLILSRYPKPTPSSPCKPAPEGDAMANKQEGISTKLLMKSLSDDAKCILGGVFGVIGVPRQKPTRLRYG